MVDVILLGLLAFVVSEAIIFSIEWCLGLLDEKLPDGYEAWLGLPPLSEADKELIDKNRELLRSKFPEGNMGEELRSMSREDRIKLLIDILEEASRNYDVEISSVKFAPSDELGYGCYGYYAHDENRIVLNLDMVCCDNTRVLSEIVDTVFHELRHAQQYRAVTDENYNYGTDEQRLKWGLNFMPGHYIRAEVDFEKYQEQAVEADARQVANESTKDF
jgi:hypothetical protein